MNVLCTAFDLYKAFTSHITTINLEHTNQIRLAEFAGLTDSSNIHSNTKILLDFLFHINTPSGLNLVHLGLFY